MLDGGVLNSFIVYAGLVLLSDSSTDAGSRFLAVLMVFMFAVMLSMVSAFIVETLLRFDFLFSLKIFICGFMLLLGTMETHSLIIQWLQL